MAWSRRRSFAWSRAHSQVDIHCVAVFLHSLRSGEEDLRVIGAELAGQLRFYSILHHRHPSLVSSACMPCAARRTLSPIGKARTHLHDQRSISTFNPGQGLIAPFLPASEVELAITPSPAVSGIDKHLGVDHGGVTQMRSARMPDDRPALRSGYARGWSSEIFRKRGAGK